MATAEQQIRKIIDDTTELMTGTLFEVTANVDSADVGRVINAVQLDLFEDAMNIQIKGVLQAGFITELSALTQVSRYPARLYNHILILRARRSLLIWAN